MHANDYFKVVIGMLKYKKVTVFFQCQEQYGQLQRESSFLKNRKTGLCFEFY